MTEEVQELKKLEEIMEDEPKKTAAEMREATTNSIKAIRDMEAKKIIDGEGMQRIETAALHGKFQAFFALMFEPNEELRKYMEELHTLGFKAEYKKINDVRGIGVSWEAPIPG